MTTNRVNEKWREMAKPVTATEEQSGLTLKWPSVYEAARDIANERQCRFDTAKKAIKRSIKTGGVSYGAVWHYANEQ